MVARPLLGCSTRRGDGIAACARRRAAQQYYQIPKVEMSLIGASFHKSMSSQGAERHGLVAERQRAPIHDDGLVAERHLEAERRAR